MRAIVAKLGTFVNVQAFLWIFWIDHVSTIAQAEVSSVRKVVASMLATAACSRNLILAFPFLVAAPLIGVVSAIILEIANILAVDALLVYTFEIREYVRAGSRSVGTQGVVVLVGAISAVINAITDIISRNTLEIATLEFMDLVASECF